MPKALTAVKRNIRLRYLVAIPLLLLLVGLTAISITLTQAKSDNHPVTISGTGTIVNMLTQTITPLNSCVNLYARNGSSTFTGIITTDTPGQLVSHIMSNGCTTPAQSVFYAVFTLSDVTVSDTASGLSKTGGITLETKGSFVGLPSDVGGAQVTFQITVLSGSGDLKGVTGHGIAVANATTTGSSIIYWIQLEFGNSEQ